MPRTNSTQAVHCSAPGQVQNIALVDGSTLTLGLDLGITGAPETFAVNAMGQGIATSLAQLVVEHRMEEWEAAELARDLAYNLAKAAYKL